MQFDCRYIAPYYLLTFLGFGVNHSMAISGTVKWLNDRLGYGFLQRDDGDDVFFHYSVLERDESLEEGEDVEFEITDGPKGPMATAVSKL